MIEQLQFLDKHDCKIAVLCGNYDLKCSIDIENLGKIFVPFEQKNKFQKFGKSFRNQFSTEIKLNSNRISYVNLFRSGVVRIKTNSFSNFKLTVNHICAMLNINKDGLFDVDIKPTMITYYSKQNTCNIDKINNNNPNCNIIIKKCEQFKFSNLEFVDKHNHTKINYKIFVYPNGRTLISDITLDGIVNQYVYLYTYLKLPIILSILKNNKNSWFSYLLPELIDHIIFSL